MFPSSFLLVVAAAGSLFVGSVDAFTLVPSSPSLVRPSFVEIAASKGMGMGTPTKKKNKKGGKSKSGFSSGGKSSFHVNASLLRLEKKYDDLILANAKTLQKEERDVDDTVTTEYVIAARSSDPSASVSDWVPVAQLVLARTSEQADRDELHGASDPVIRAAISAYCRELCHVAGLGARVFQSIPRNELQYSVEPVDSFFKHVYEVVVEGKNEDAENEGVMTKKEARKVLGFDENDMALEMSDIKKSYRSKSFELHPDRFAGDEQEAEKDRALIEYSRVKLAYETLSSGLRRSKGDEKQSSWYASLGGRARNDFHGPVDLISLKKGEEVLESSKLQSALVGLDPEMVQGFVTRCHAMVVN